MLGLLLPQLLVFLLRTQITLSDTPTSYFTHPSDSGDAEFYTADEVYVLNSQVNITWVTDLDVYGIWIWQQDVASESAAIGDEIYSKYSGATELGHFLWSATVGSFDLNFSPVFFLSLGPFSGLTNSSTSHYFNISASAVAATTSSSASTQTPITGSHVSSTTSTVTTTASLGTSMKTGSPAQKTSSAPSTGSTGASSNNGSSTSEVKKIGLGVGLGIGIPLILILAAMLGLRIRKIIKKPGRGNSASTMGLSLYPEHPKFYSDSDHSHPHRFRHNSKSPYELPAQSVRVEPRELEGS